MRRRSRAGPSLLPAAAAAGPQTTGWSGGKAACAACRIDLRQAAQAAFASSQPVLQGPVAVEVRDASDQTPALAPPFLDARLPPA